MPRPPDPNSLRSEVARRGVSLWTVRKERAVRRGANPRALGTSSEPSEDRLAASAERARRVYASDLDRRHDAAEVER